MARRSEEDDLLEAVEHAQDRGTPAQVANAFDHLAIYYHDGSSYADAAEAYNRALGLWRQILGPDHPTIGTLSLNLGTICLEMGNLDRAEPLFHRALGIFEADPSPDDEGICQALRHFVQKLEAAGRSAQARSISERVAEIERRVQATARA